MNLRRLAVQDHPGGKPSHFAEVRGNGGQPAQHDLVEGKFVVRYDPDVGSHAEAGVFDVAGELDEGIPQL